MPNFFQSSEFSTSRFQPSLSSKIGFIFFATPFEACCLRTGPLFAAVSTTAPLSCACGPPVSKATVCRSLTLAFLRSASSSKATPRTRRSRWCVAHAASPGGR